ncbi:hypothetical protein GCM10025861_27770 (plasmid) [Methanobacterium petrolearium]|nr:hypothetical protein GCM10025861_27770 [Methanobacterium petrolearium]
METIEEQQSQEKHNHNHDHDHGKNANRFILYWFSISSDRSIFE